MALGLEERATQIWGSIHAESMEAAVRNTLDIVGEHLALGMSHGEVNDPRIGEQEDWIVGNVKKARYIPGVEVVKDGDLHDYDSIPEHRLSRRIDSDDIELGYHRAARMAAPLIRREVERIGRPDLGTWIGIADGKQLPSFLFGNIKTPGSLPDIPRGGIFPKYYRPFVKATNREIKFIYNDPALRDNAVVSLESPGATIGTLQMARVSKRAGKLAAHTFAKGIVTHVNHMPEDATVAVHLCWGRYQGEAFESPDPQQVDALEPLLDLANEVVDQWPKGHRPPALIGLPLGAESQRTTTNPRYFQLLSDLVVPRETRIGAGIITPQTPLEDLVTIVRILDQQTGRLVVPMAPCGLASLRYGPKGTLEQTLQKHADVVRATK